MSIKDTEAFGGNRKGKSNSALKFSSVSGNVKLPSRRRKKNRQRELMIKI